MSKLSYADLHLHTIYSDGFLTPSEVIHNAKRFGISALSITDHDTVSGIEESVDICGKLNIEFLSGIEVSGVLQDEEIHILGYLIDWKDERLQKELNSIKEIRLKRAESIINKLKEIGLKIDFEEFLTFAGIGTISRLHIAYFLYNKKIVPTIYEAFSKYIGTGKPAYEPVKGFTAKEAIEFILRYRGIPIYAHPSLHGMDNIIPMLIGYGIKGIEAFHSSHSAIETERYRKMADDYGLLVTGGSDCHGKGKGEVSIGKTLLDYKYVDDLKKFYYNNFAVNQNGE